MFGKLDVDSNKRASMSRLYKWYKQYLHIKCHDLYAALGVGIVKEMMVRRRMRRVSKDTPAIRQISLALAVRDGDDLVSRPNRPDALHAYITMLAIAPFKYEGGKRGTYP